MARSLLLAGCRWLRQKLDSVERFAQVGDSRKREPQVASGLHGGGDAVGRGDVDAVFQGYVADARQNALSGGELEEHYRRMAASQQSQLPNNIDYGRGQIVSHEYLQWVDAQASVNTAVPRVESGTPQPKRKKGAA